MGINTKKAAFFSTDAIIAVLIIFLVLIVYPYVKKSHEETEIHGDLINSLSSLKIGELNNSYSQLLIQNGMINDTNKSVLEAIGELYVTDISTAITLGDSILNGIETNKNIGIWFDNNLLFSKNSSPYETAENIRTTRQTISGIKGGGPSTGFVAKSWIRKIEGKKTLLVIRGDLMCGKWSNSNNYCGSGKTDIQYDINIPQNATIINSWWLVEPAWVGQPTALFVNNNLIFNGTIPYFITLNITPYLIPGYNTANLSSITGGDDGASHIVVEYNLSDIQTFTEQNKFYFNTMQTKAQLYQEKAIIIPNTISSMNVSLNTTSSNVNLSIRSGAKVVTIGIKNSTNGIVTFTDTEIKSALSSNGLTYSNLSDKYFFVVVKAGTTGDASLRNNSYVEIQTSSQTDIPFGSIDITQEIKINSFSNRLQDKFYKNIGWQFFIPVNAIPVIADWQLGWLSTSTSATSQEARANGIILYDSPPDPFIPAFSRFGYTSNIASGVFKENENNFTLDFGNTYAVSNESSFGSITYFIRSFVNYGNTFEKAKGGTRTIEFETGGQSTAFVIGDGSDPWDPEIDAVDDAIERLIVQLDANGNGKVDVILTQDNIEISTLDISGVPFLWSTEVQARSWY